MEEMRTGADFVQVDKNVDPVLIRLQNLKKTYGAKPALNGLDLELGRGKIVGLLGPNGSGKTTLIKILNGLLRPTEGIALIDGYAPGVETKARVSYLPDRMYFADWMRACDLMDFFSDFYADFDRQKAAEMFSALGIRPTERIKTMSKGTKEKVQLVLVMSRKADSTCSTSPSPASIPLPATLSSAPSSQTTTRTARSSSPPTSFPTSSAYSMRSSSCKTARSFVTTPSTTSAPWKASRSISSSAKSFARYPIREVTSNVW